MKKDHTNLIKIIFIIILLFPNICFADDFLAADWNYSSFRKKSKIVENADMISFEQVRGNQDFSEYFDKQVISILKKTYNMSPQDIGKAYLARTLMGDNSGETYFLKNEKNNFEAVFCSKKLQRCEIISYYSGYKGIIELKYIHNNLWHFQNNIGAFREIQNRIIFYPFPMIKNYIFYDERKMRL